MKYFGRIEEGWGRSRWGIFYRFAKEDYAADPLNMVIKVGLAGTIYIGLGRFATLLRFRFEL